MGFIGHEGLRHVLTHKVAPQVSAGLIVGLLEVRPDPHEVGACNRPGGVLSQLPLSQGPASCAPSGPVWRYLELLRLLEAFIFTGETVGGKLGFLASGYRQGQWTICALATNCYKTQGRVSGKSGVKATIKYITSTKADMEVAGGKARQTHRTDKQRLKMDGVCDSMRTWVTVQFQRDFHVREAAIWIEVQTIKAKDLRRRVKCSEPLSVTPPKSRGII